MRHPGAFKGHKRTPIHGQHCNYCRNGNVITDNLVPTCKRENRCWYEANDEKCRHCALSVLFAKQQVILGVRPFSLTCCRSRLRGARRVKVLRASRLGVIHNPHHVFAVILLHAGTGHGTLPASEIYPFCRHWTRTRAENSHYDIFSTNVRYIHRSRGGRASGTSPLQANGPQPRGISTVNVPTTRMGIPKNKPYRNASWRFADRRRDRLPLCS